MALAEKGICIECGIEFCMINKTQPCIDCRAEKENKAKDEHFKKLDALTVEERLRLLEFFEYAMKYKK